VYEGAREEGKTETITDGEGEKAKTETVTLLGARSGVGKATFPNGDVYEGSFEKGARSGVGKYSYAAPLPASDEEPPEEPLPPVATYEGSWKNGHKTGVGTMVYADGSRYQGSWLKGVRHGIGAFFYANGDIYSGNWESGKKHGQGTYFFKTTDTHMKGEWVQGKYIEGNFSDRYGNVFEGKFTGDAGTVGYVVGGGMFTNASGAVAPA